jgi:DNA polymerase III subunit epsilon
VTNSMTTPATAPLMTMTKTPSLSTRLSRLFSRKPKHPLLAGAAEHFATLDQNQPLSNYEFVVLDTELTGLSHRRDEIVSIGAVRIRDLSIVPGEQFYSLVEPRIPLPKKSTLIHRITPQQVQGRPRLRQVLPELMEFIGNAFIVGHYVGLDISFLNSAARDIIGEKLVTPCLDTMRLAQVYQEALFECYYDRYQKHISYNLKDLSKHHGLPLFPQHNALQDAMQTAYLFLFLAKKLKDFNVLTLRQLYLAGRSWRWYL